MYGTDCLYGNEEMQLSLVIPAYNEGNRIRKAIISYNNELMKHYHRYEIIVVLNGCIDDTPQVIEELEAEIPELRCLTYAERLGKGGAIAEGLKECRGHVAGFTDADDAFNAKEMVAMIKELDDCSGVIASKWKGQKFMDVDEPFIRKILSRVWNILVRVMLGIDFTDTQAGSKFFKKSVLDFIGYDYLVTGFAFDVELLKKLRDEGFTMKEVYVSSKYVEESKFGFNHIPIMFIDLLRVWWNNELYIPLT